MGYSPWGHKESNTIEQLSTAQQRPKAVLLVKQMGIVPRRKSEAPGQLSYVQAPSSPVSCCFPSAASVSQDLGSKQD